MDSFGYIAFKRHPKQCHYGRYGRCKFDDYCRFSHHLTHTNFYGKKTEDIEGKLFSHGKTLLEIQEKLSQLEKTVTLLKECILSDEETEEGYDEDLEFRVEALEIDKNVILHTLDEALSSVIILKSQMKQIFPNWCDDCGVDYMDEWDLKRHRKEKHAKSKSNAKKK